MSNRTERRQAKAARRTERERLIALGRRLPHSHLREIFMLAEAISRDERLILWKGRR